mgnify:CR=1 FL=1
MDERVPYTICVTGARTALNNGTLAIICSGIEELNAALNGNASFYILSPGVDVDEQRYLNNIDKSCQVAVVGLNYNPKIPYPIRIAQLTLKSIKYYSKSDIIIDMRGEGYVNTPVAITQSLQLLLSKIARKPFVVYAQSLGPFNTKVNRVLSKFTLNRAALITIREPISLDYVKDLDINKGVHLCTDQAMLLQPLAKKQSQEELIKFGISLDRPIIGISPVPKDNLMKLMADISDYLIEKYNVSVVFVPHAIDEIYGGCAGNNDLLAAHRVHEIMKNKDSAYVIDETYHGKRLKGIMGCCDIYISCRWHAAIASISLANPTIVISSAHKSAAMDMVGLSDYVLDPAVVDFDTLRNKVEDCWTNQKLLREHLEGKSDYIREMGLKSAELTSKLLNEHHHE